MSKPYGFGNQLLILIAFLLLFPIILTVYMLHIIRNSELALIENQKAKLSRAAAELDENISISFTDILKKPEIVTTTRKEKILLLNNELKEPIWEVAKKYPNLDIGIYSNELDVFLDASNNYEENFSKRRKEAFEEAINRKEAIVQTLGQSTGGDILEIYQPLYKKGQIEGVIRVAENLSQTRFYQKVKQVETTSYSIIIVGIVLGLGGTLLMLQRFVKNVDQIKKGLQVLQYDLNQKLPTAPGELGEIATAINRLATRLVDTYKYNEIMMATIDDGLLVVDSNGIVVIANQAAINMLGLVCECRDENFGNIFPENSPFQPLLARTLHEHEQFKDIKLYWNSPSRGPLQLLASTALLLDSKQEIIGAVLCCRDVTERMRLEEKVHRQERLAALGKLVAGVAHEIRNPLTSISCYIQLWQKHNNPSPTSLATMYREVSRLDAIVDQLLYFAKPAEANFITYNLNQLVEKILQFFIEVHQAKFTVIKNLDNSLPLAWLDPEQVERVLMNIMYNASQAMPEGGLLKVETGHDPRLDSLFIIIADSGCGIPKEHLSRLFDPFFSTKEKGTGLGLAIAHEIVQAHGGSIEVESEVGKGTTFRIYLQCKKEEAFYAKDRACCG